MMMDPIGEETWMVVYNFLKYFSKEKVKLKETLKEIFNLTTLVSDDEKQEHNDEILHRPDDIYEHNSVDEFYCNEMLPYLVESSLVKGVERAIPAGILHEDYSCTLTDYRPNTRDHDEVMYSKEEVLRTMLPRGVCVMNLTNQNGGSVTDTVIYGQKKFSGSTLCDEDDASADFELLPNKYFLRNPKLTTNVVSAEKINGEAAHLSGRFIGGEFYLIGGSKNVHMIFQNKEHIQKYNESRYDIARHISLAFLHIWESLDHQRRLYLAIILHLTRVTLVGELKMPNHQHVVHFENLETNTLVLFSITSSPPSTKENKSFTALPTKYALELLEQFHFEVAQFSKIHPDEVEDDKERVRKLLHEEGRVYYYEDCEGNTIGLLKLKSKWYIHLRALRQQASYRHRTSLKNNMKKKKTIEEAKKKSRARLDELQTWLHNSNDELEAWKNVSDEWFMWLEDNISTSNESGQYEPRDVRDNFPAVWKPFMDKLKAGSPNIHGDLKLLGLMS